MRASAGVRLAMRAVGAIALLLVFLVGPVRAQAGASTGLMGKVTDSSGAARKTTRPVRLSPQAPADPGLGWDLPFRGNPFVEAWQIAGIGTFQSGRPFTIIDGDFSAVLVGTTAPRPDLAPGATHEDQTTGGSTSERINNYLNRDAFVSSGSRFGDLGRNTVIGPDQRRVDLSISKMTRLMGDPSMEFRIEAYNVTNTPTFRNPNRDIASANFGMITRTRGGPRVIELGLKFRF